MSKVPFHYFTLEDVEKSENIAQTVDNIMNVLDNKIIPNIKNAEIRLNHNVVTVTLGTIVVYLNKESTGRGTPQELKLKIQQGDNAVGFKTLAKGRAGQDRDKWHITTAMKWYSIYDAVKKAIEKQPDYNKLNSWLDNLLED